MPLPVVFFWQKQVFTSSVFVFICWSTCNNSARKCHSDLVNA